MDIPAIDFPNSDKEFIDNPYPYMKELRETSPIHYDTFSGLNLITKFEDVKAYKQVRLSLLLTLRK